MMRVIPKIIVALFSAYLLVHFGSIFWWFRLPEEFWVIATGTWLFSWIALEVFTDCSKQNRFPRLLTHLRYAPMGVLAFFLVSVIAYDQAMVLHSKWKIHRYVFGKDLSTTAQSLELHNTHRGWCGNGYSAATYATYGESAADGFESPEPSVRARSLEVSIRVYDWLNGSSDGPFPQLIERAKKDPDPEVRRIANDAFR